METSTSTQMLALLGTTRKEMGQGQEGEDQEKVTTLVDPILKLDLDHISTFGFPVIVVGTSYPPKPLCFLCGSAGINQLVYCSMCCEPYHPYCSGDDLLMDTCLARYTRNSNGDSDSSSCRKANDNVEDDSTSEIVLKWTCRRCISCKACGTGIGVGNKELIRCTRCRSPFHLQSCIDKAILSKVKDLNKLKRVWICDPCLKCKSCGKTIEPQRKVHTIQQAAAAATTESSDEEDEDDDNASNSVTSAHQNQNCLMLCIDCFKRRKKGSYCPICEVCYDDNDWDTKMMECSECSRWIHATCEGLTDEQYTIVGKLPDYIEYVCKLCHPQDAGHPLWYTAVISLLVRNCSSALRLFERKSLGLFARKRSSVSLDQKPSFVCNLFPADNSDELEVDTATEVLSNNEEEFSESMKVSSLRSNTNTPSKFPSISSGSPKKSKTDEPVSYKQILDCKVMVRDFLKYPKTAEEKEYLEILRLGNERLHDFNDNVTVMEAENNVKSLEVTNNMRVSRTRTLICTTPVKVKSFTPAKHVASITDSIKNIISSVRSVYMFQRALVQEIENSCENIEEIEALTKHANEAINDTFPWYEHNEPELSLVDSECSTDIPEDSCDDALLVPYETDLASAVDPFTEEFWNPNSFFDYRVCVLCGEMGDFPSTSCGRLLWCGINEWIHCNCAIWSSEVWERDDGALQQIGAALNRGKILRCKICNKKGATVSCCQNSCKNSYHFLCAQTSNCYLLDDKTMFCSHHNLTERQKNSIQHDMQVARKVFVDLDWLHKKGVKAASDEIRIVVGSLRIATFGCVIPISVTEKDWEQGVPTTCLVPKNYQAERLFWSIDNPLRKETYVFTTWVDCNGFENKVHDVGVNIVVNHHVSQSKIQRRLDGIKRFHQWLKKAPKYIDEDFNDWLPFCYEEFCDDDEKVDVDIRDLNLNKRILQPRVKNQCSPTSSSSSGNSEMKNLRDVENTSTGSSEGYASSVGSASIFESNKLLKQEGPSTPKRRRTTPKRKCKTNPKTKYTFTSPRRRSIRNRYLLEGCTDNNTCSSRQELRTGTKINDDSDGDSGLVESEGGNGDGDIEPCRINLLSKFEESIEVPQNQNSISPLSQLDEDTQFAFDFPTCDVNKVLALRQPNTIDIESLADSEETYESKIYRARIKFGIKRARCKNELICESFDAHTVWTDLFEKISYVRHTHNLSKLTSPSLNSSPERTVKANSFRMMGLTHHAVQAVIEQLPGVISTSDRHTFRYGHRPFVDCNDANRPLPLNSYGSARAQGFTGRKPHDMFGWLASKHRKVNMDAKLSEEATRVQKSLPHAMLFRDLKGRAKERFVVLHSEIHGRGLFSRCDVEKGDMLIEYAGEVIRPSLTDPRERYYESKGIGCYMFRIKTQVIDATMKGNAARFINHSCDPNCEAKTVRILGKDHIIIFALRKIFKGEELTYDYKFEREENKIPCSCGSSRCRKYMN